MNQILDLAGEWLFKLDKEKQGLTSHYDTGVKSPICLKLSELFQGSGTKLC